jgi:hypothetical protein
MAELRNAIEPDRATFYADYNMGSTQALTDNGISVNYIRKVYLDTTNLTTNDMVRQVNYYVYNNAGNVLAKITDVFTIPEIRIDVGNTGDSTNHLGGLMDSSQQNWTNDTQAYSSTNQVPGTVGAASTTTGSNAATVTNVQNTDNPIYQTYREATSGQIEYKLDVPNDDYVVQLYFTEFDTTVTAAASHRRRADISINGSTVDTNYSPWESTKGYKLGEVRSYPVTVSGNNLDIIVKDATAGTDLHPRLMGLMISRTNY